jgi:hypothetical protein
MAAVDLEASVARSRLVELSAVPWAEVQRHPVSLETIRTLRYMQDIEAHTKAPASGSPSRRASSTATRAGPSSRAPRAPAASSPSSFLSAAKPESVRLTPEDLLSTLI